MFGPTVFEKYVYLDTGADKDHVLEQYRDTGCWWVEDKYTNARTGYELGLNSLLMTHDHNDAFVDQNITKVSNWREIYERIVG